MRKRRRRNRRSLRSSLLQCYRATDMKKHPYIRFENRVQLIADQMKRDKISFRQLDEDYIELFLKKVSCPLERIFYQETFALIHYGNEVRAERFNAKKTHKIFSKKESFQQAEKILEIMENDREEIEKYRDLKLFTLRLIRDFHAHGIHVHFYEAKTSNSFYLKLDYGVLRSIRISDHLSPTDSLHYTYNVTLGDKKTRTENHRKFYPLSNCSFDDLIHTVLTHRNHLMNTYKYSTILRNEKEKERYGNRFWKRAISY